MPADDPDADRDNDKFKRSSIASNPKRASHASSYSTQRSRPHSAAELFYPQPQSFQNLSEVTSVSSRSGPHVVDASQHGIVIEDEPEHRSSSRRINRASYQSIGRMSETDSRPRSSRRHPSRPRIQDEYTLTEEMPVEHLSELAAPAPVPEPDDDSDELYRDDSPAAVRSSRGGRDSRRTSRRDSRHTRRSSRGRGISTGRPSYRSSSQTYNDPEHQLSELAAPAPTISPPSPYRSRMLEASLMAGEDETWIPEERDEKHPAEHTAFEPVVTHLFILSYLVFFSILGTLARLGIQWLTFYPGAPVVLGVLWANFSGSLLMGFFSEDRMLFREAQHSSHRTSPSGARYFRARSLMDESRFSTFLKMKKTIPLYIGLTTGFCGSFTSFSSFMRDVFLALSNDLTSPYSNPSNSPHSFHAAGSTVHRNGGYSFMALVAVIILTISLSLSGLKIGAHLALLTERLPFPLHIFGLPRARIILDIVMPILATGSWLGAIFLAVWPPDRPGGPSSRGSWSNETWRGEAVFACVFAPVGCLLRFYASVGLNGLQPSFPLGTFAVNVFGTAVLGMAWDLQHVSLASGIVGGGRVGCQVLQGVMDGFCGALTTVSTWVVELDNLKRRHAWVYGGTSVGIGLGLLVVIMGSVRWSIGFTEPVCVT